MRVAWRVTCCVISRNDVALIVPHIMCRNDTYLTAWKLLSPVLGLGTRDSRRDDATRAQRCARCKVWVSCTAFSVGMCCVHGRRSYESSCILCVSYRTLLLRVLLLLHNRYFEVLRSTPYYLVPGIRYHCVNFWSFLFGIACDTPSIKVDTTEQ